MASTESGSSWPASQGAAPDLVGKTIAGRYRIVSKLGEGGMGAVYRGEQMSLKRAVAVKLLRPELSTNQMILQRFNAEAQAVAKLSHPNTVNIYDFGQDTDGSLFIAMEFIEGRSLRGAMQKEAPFPPARALQIAIQVAASLSDAHAHNIVHRDLKPDNVMLQDRGRQKDVVRVLDFGIAKLRDDSRATQAAMTQAGDMLGTPQYMAPEQIRGEPIDGRTDVYALGCMLYEMVTARLPYEAPTIMAMLSKHLLENPVPPTQRRPDLRLPPAIDQLVLTAMAKDPSARPPTMDQFAELLAAFLATLPGDPNRSAPMSIQQGVVSAALTPPALSAYQASPGFQPPTPAPAAFTPAPPAPYQVAATPPAPYAPPPIAPTMPVAGRPPASMQSTMATRKSRAPLFIVLGAVVLAGGGAAAYLATQKDHDTKQAAVDKPTDPVVTPGSDTPTPTPTPTDDKWATKDDPSKDPWAVKNGGTAPKDTKVGTAKVPLPSGAYIDPPDGFAPIKLDSESQSFMDNARNILIVMGPLEGGTNDPDKLAKAWTRGTSSKFLKRDKVPSHGKSRDMLVFTTVVNGVTMGQIAVLYISDKYRFGVLLQAPADLIQDSDFQQEIDSIYENNVHIP